MNDYLIKKYPMKLIQTGTFKEEKDLNLMGMKRYITLDEKNSKLFSWGALPRSINRMIYNYYLYEIFKVPNLLNQDNKFLYIYAPFINKEYIINLIKKLVNGETLLEEDCHFNLENTNPNFWWDIENDFYFFFGINHANIILEMQELIKSRSIGYIDAMDKKKLLSYYNNFKVNKNKQRLLLRK